MDDELRALWERMETDLSALAAECDMPLQDAGIVRDYLSHDEFGVALEHLCDILIETDSQITGQQYTRLLAAAATLKVLGSQAWSERMTALAARVR